MNNLSFSRANKIIIFPLNKGNSVIIYMVFVIKYRKLVVRQRDSDERYF